MFDAERDEADIVDINLRKVLVFDIEVLSFIFVEVSVKIVFVCKVVDFASELG